MHTTHNPSSITHNPAAEKHAFSSKERDAETGLSVTSLRSVSSLPLGHTRTSSNGTRWLRRFGARYYSSDLSIWLSVAPMADKYPSLSQYTYCANNPMKLVDPNGEEYSNPDGWIMDNENRTITWVSNDGGDMAQYVNGKLESLKSKKDFIKEYAEKGYVVNMNDATKSLGDAFLDTYSGSQKGWDVLSKQHQQKISYDFSKALKNNGSKIQTRQLRLGINITFNPKVARRANALSATLDFADFAYSYSVLDNGKFGVNSASSLGSSAGAWGCSIAGFKMGMTLGAYFGPYGIVIGGFFGSVVGGCFGSEIGSKIGIDVYHLFK